MNELNVSNQAQSKTGLAGSAQAVNGRQKQQWEAEFWRQQRQFQSEDRPLDTAQRAGAGRNNSAAKLTAAAVGPNRIAAPNAAIQSAVATKPQDQATVNQLNNRQTVTTSTGTPHAFATHYRTTEPSAVKASVTTATPASLASKTLATGLVQLQGNNASVWLGNSALKQQTGFFQRLQQALQFFGLKLHRLTIHGEKVTAVQGPLPDNQQQENGNGN